MTAIVETVGIDKSFGGVQAVKRASVTFEEGYLYGLIGPNGAGKSTLVNLISGELRADKGQVLLAGDDITTLPAHARTHRGIGRTFQHTRPIGAMTVLETVMSGALISANTSVIGYLLQRSATRSEYRAARDTAWEILDLVGLSEAAHQVVRELAWANQRRLEVARALSLQPRLLLLDEPTAGMHIESLPGVAAMLRELVNQGLAVVVIEHNVPFIRNTVDRLYAMDFGSIIAHGEPEEVLTSEAVVRSYLGENRD